jgi:hypothetical protein
MPLAMQELWSRLGYEGPPSVEAPAPEGNRITVGDPLFPRIETA